MPSMIFPMPSRIHSLFSEIQPLNVATSRSSLRQRRQRNRGCHPPDHGRDLDDLRLEFRCPLHGFRGNDRADVVGFRLEFGDAVGPLPEQQHGFRGEPVGIPQIFAVAASIPLNWLA